MRDGLKRLEEHHTNEYREVTSQPWFRDGLTGEESALVAVLPQLAYEGSDLFRALLESHHMRSGMISLPLAGDVNVWIVQKHPVRTRFGHSREDRGIYLDNRNVFGRTIPHRRRGFVGR